MKITAIFRDLSDEFWHGFGDSIPAFLNLSPLAQFERAQSLANKMPRNVSVKIGNGSFRDRVEWNQAMRDATRKERMKAKIEPRRGYRLFTFEI
jgi:hypothetical protein